MDKTDWMMASVVIIIFGLVSLFVSGAIKVIPAP